jgi:hypothetical protein
VRKSALVFILLLLASPLVPGVARSEEVPEVLYYYRYGAEPTPSASVRVLDSNSSENLTAFLVLDSIADIYAGEPVNLSVWWAWTSPEGPGNASIEVTLGLDEGGPPAMSGEVCIWGSEVDNRTYPEEDCLFQSASVVLAPEAGTPNAIAQVAGPAEVLNLSHALQVRPSRVLLSAEMDLPEDVDSLPELSVVTVQIRFQNDGGLDALSYTFDFRYAGRIFETRFVNLVPALGERTLDVDILPVHGGGDLEVHVVAGADAPFKVATMAVPTEVSPVLRVVSITPEKESVVKGAHVTFAAEVVNQGNATATVGVVELLVDGAVVDNASIEGLGPGNSTKVTLGWEAGVPGVHSVAVRIEDSEFDAQAVPIEVTSEAPAINLAGLIVALLVAAALTRAVSRSG